MLLEYLKCGKIDTEFGEKWNIVMRENEVINEANEYDIKKDLKKAMFYINRLEFRMQLLNNLNEIALLSEPETFKEFLSNLMKYSESRSYIENNWKHIINNATNAEQLLPILAQDEKIRKEILENVPYLLKYCEINFNDIGVIAESLSKIDGGKEAISKNFELLFKECNSNLDLIVTSSLENEEYEAKIKEELKNGKIQNNVSEFFNIISAMKGNERFKEEYEMYSYWAELYKKIDISSENCTVDSLINVFSNDEENPLVRAEIIAKKRRKDKIFKSIINSQEREELKVVLDYISEGNEVSYKGIGASSLVIQSGEKIAKIGLDRIKYNIPYHKRIMMPKFRKKYDDGIIFEIFDLGDTTKGKVTSEDVLSIFKELEKDGIFWGDAKKENVLVLKKKNTLPDYIKSKDFNVFGFLEDKDFPTQNHEALNAGDFVICDLDFLYRTDDKEIMRGQVIDTMVEVYLANKASGESELTDINFNFNFNQISDTKSEKLRKLAIPVRKNKKERESSTNDELEEK